MFSLEFNQIKRVLRFFSVLPQWLKITIPIGRQIGMLRTALGMSQMQLAKKTKTGQRVIVRLEKEEGDPKLSTLQKTAEALNCQLLVRMIPKEDLEKYLQQRALQRAKELIAMSTGLANLELQRPSAKIIEEEIQRMTQYILHSKRSSLWED